ncbi:MAG: hypothetical protein K6G01_03640 [Eubacterium sp.]|nr:hypothetical protein [Eubacterium sp.]
MKEPDLSRYLKILKNTIYEKPVEACLKDVTTPQDQMYLTVWAPPLIEYVRWVLQEAVKDGIERLYFLARDAHPMYLAAKKLAEAMHLPIECRYLRVSRYALRVPEFHLIGEACLERIFLSGIDISMQQILLRAKLSKEQMQTVVRQLGYDKPLDQVLNRHEIQQLKEQARVACTTGKCDLLDYVYDISKAAYEQTIGYLKQEGLLDDVKWAVVDSGWVGTIQLSLYHLLAPKKPDLRISGYYFGLYELPPNRQGCEYKAYYFMPKGNIDRKSRFSNCLYEVMYSEDCPMVESYQRNGERYEPVLSKVESPNGKTLHKNAELLHKLLEKIIGQKSQKVDAEDLLALYLNSLSGSIDITEKLYQLVMSEPGAWEANYYGSFLFSDDVIDGHMKNAANVLSQQEIKDLRAISKLKIMLGVSKKVIHESAWIEGSIVNAGGHVKKNLRGARRAKYLTHLRQSLKSRQ